MAVRESGSPHQRARIELEKEDTEVQVGPYRADIVARAPIDDSRVVIENQLEEANLQHLGQVLAYLAGLEARIVVWIARDFMRPIFRPFAG